jgi:hypothetical protein
MRYRFQKSKIECHKPWILWYDRKFTRYHTDVKTGLDSFMTHAHSAPVKICDDTKQKTARFVQDFFCLNKKMLHRHKKKQKIANCFAIVATKLRPAVFKQQQQQTKRRTRLISKNIFS